MATDLAFHLASRGWDVEVITSRQRYDDPRARLTSGIANGVRVARIWSTRFGRGGLVGRALDYATFYLSAFFAIRSRAGRGTIVVSMTDPPLLSVVAAAAMPRQAILVNWVQDLFPEVAEALGMRALRVLRGVRDRSLRRAHTNVVLGEKMAARVPRPVVQHNWADAALAPLPREAGAPFTVAYSGNLGRAHDVETIAGAMRRLPSTRFTFTGGGARMAAVRNEPNATLLPYAPRERLAESLSAADVHLVSLRPELEGLIVPSKFYGVVAVGRPVIFIGATDGELARIIEEHRCGVVVASGDAEGLARAIRELEADPARAAEMGRRGREAYLARFAPSLAFAAWERILTEAAR